MEFAVLGPLQVLRRGEPVEVPGIKERALLAHLVASGGRMVPTEDLIDDLWGNDPPRTAAKSLQNYVLRLRNALEPDRNGLPRLLVTDGPGYRLVVPDDAVDARRFTALVDLGRRAQRDGRTDAARATLAHALSLWRGPAYSGFERTRFGGGEAHRLEELRLAALEDRLTADLDLGRAREVVPELEAAVHGHPLRERLWQQLVLALYRSGRQADALAAYGRARDVLVEELGVEPGEELRRLHAQVLAQDRALQRPETRDVPATLRPGPGTFAGRDAELGVLREAWVGAVRGRPSTIVLRGPPGAGTRRLAGELAAEVAGQGFDVRDEETLASVDVSPARPTLTVARTAPAVPPSGPRMVLVLGDPSLAVPPGARALDLGPLPSDAVHAVLRDYLDADTARQVLPEVLASTSGLPGPVRERALTLVQHRAATRVEKAASLTGDAQRTLDAARDVLRNGVTAFREAAERRETPYLDVCPWRGLAAYDVDDAPWFSGRERLAAELLTRLLPAPLLAVVGASGSGKSSLVRAGLLGSLRAGALPGSERWPLHVLRPGQHPMRELAGIALDADADAVLVIDQLEEVWTACSDAADRSAFLDALSEVATSGGRCSVVLTVRADYVGELADHPTLASLVGDSTVLVGAPSPEEVRRAVERPAARAGLELDTGLADAVVADAGGEPGLLPLLSTALVELWEHRQDTRLTLASYVAAGGVRGAVARIAERAYSGLDDDDRAAARVLLLRLAGPGDSDTVTRRRVPLRELEALPDARVRAVVEPLAEARLLSLSAGHVEVAHEALFREWPRLRGWLAEDASARGVQRRLTVAAAEWDAGGRETTDLWRGGRLHAAAEFGSGHADEVTDVETAFVTAGQEVADAERRAAEERAAAAARQNRRLRFLLGGLGAVLVVALVLGTLATRASDRAEREAGIAVARELTAAASANLGGDAELAVLLALEALERAKPAGGPLLADARETLHRAVVASRVVGVVPGIGGELDWSPDGHVFVTEGPPESGVVDIRDAVTFETLRSFPGHDGDVIGVAFSSDGARVASSGDDGSARIWDTASGEPLATLPGGGEVAGPTFSPDGTLLAAAWLDDAVIRVWDWAAGRVELEIPTALRIGEGPTFSPDGTRIVTLVDDQFTPVVFDVASGERLFPLAGHEIDVREIDWSPDGRWIATTSNDYSVGIWDAATGNRRFTLSGHTAPVSTADWSPDSSQVASAGRDGTVRVWSVTDDGTEQVHSFTAEHLEDGVTGVAFSPDGDMLMAGAETVAAVIVWDLGISGDAEVANLPTGVYTGIDWTPDGRMLVAGTEDNTMSVWDVGSGQAELTFGPPAGMGETPYPNYQAVDVSPDGSLVATTATDGTATVWDAATGEELFTLSAPPDDVTGRPWTDSLSWHPDSHLLAVAADPGLVLLLDRAGTEVGRLRAEAGHLFEDVRFSPDGRRLSMITYNTNRYVAADHVVQIWDWDGGEVLQTLRSQAAGVAWDPAGDRVVTASTEATAEVWDVSSGERLLTLPGHEASVGDVAYSPDGSRIATSSTDRSVRIWDADTGEPLDVLRGHLDEVIKVVFSPDGEQLVSVGGCCVARVWALELDDLERIAREQVTRDLSDEECREFLHVPECAPAATGS